MAVKTLPRIYRRLPRHDADSPSALTIGNFDGVHLGHQAILDGLHAHARQAGLLSTVMTFEPHPRTFFAQLRGRPELQPGQISTRRDKLQAIARHGIRQVALLRFNQALASMPAQQFVEALLVRGLNTRWLLVGEDFRFGHQRQGDIELLRRMGADLGFQVQTIAEVLDNAGRRFSSSRLREALGEGRLEAARLLLGRPYCISGHVIHGRKLGRELGFPTLNLRVPPLCALRNGIYVVRVSGLADTVLPGVASLGVRPSIETTGERLLEVHLLDTDIQAYGKLAGVEFLSFLRDEASFSDLSTLADAIANDGRLARHYLATHGL
ncbi:MAG: bifunctional riboflavin kinase/FAD synthetase [Castellaniella sp.]